MRAAQTSMYAAVRDGSWDVVQVKVRLRIPRFPILANASHLRISSASFRERLLTYLPPTRTPLKSKQLTNFATTAAVTTAVSAVVATVLLVVSFLLVVTVRWLVVPSAPSATHQELFLDFTLAEPTATAVFMPQSSINAINALPAEKITPSILRSNRVMASGQKYDISVTLDLPESKHNVLVARTFQVTSTLLTANNVVLANATRPVNVQFQSLEVKLVKLLLKWPLYALGLATETQSIKLQMFSSVTEKKDLPLAKIETKISPRAGLEKTHEGRVPDVHNTYADISLDMNFLNKFLYNYPASSFVLMLGATWGYLCAAAFLLFSIVVALGLVKSPSKFAEEVVARAIGVIKGGDTSLDRFAFQSNMFEGTSSDDENLSGGRKSTESDSSCASDLGGASTEGLRYRGAPRQN